MNKGSRGSYYISVKDIDSLAAICQTCNRNQLPSETEDPVRWQAVGSAELLEGLDWGMFCS